LWLPPKPAGAVLYLHGIQSHGGWFEGSAARLADAGLAVLMPDRRGSGMNRDDRGHTRSARRLVQDVGEAAHWLRQTSGAEHVHLVGVSWGGKLALASYPALSPAVASLSLVTPGLFPLVDFNLRQKASVAWSAMFDRRRTFVIPLGDPALFTTQPQRQRFIRDDERNLRSATPAFFWASARMDRAKHRLHGLPPVPLAVFLAEDDHIIDNAATRAWMRGLENWPVRRLFEYAGAAHTLEFEPVSGQYVEDLTSWIVEQNRRFEEGLTATGLQPAPDRQTACPGDNPRNDAPRAD